MDVEIAVLLKCLSNFCRAHEIPLINCNANLILIWSFNSIFTNWTGVGTFVITDIKVCAPVVTLSTQDNALLLQEL